MKKSLHITLVLFLLSGLFNFSKAQSFGDYQTRAAGSWNSTTVWETYGIFGLWSPTSTPPTNSSPVITIRHSITIAGGLAVNADQIVIAFNGTLTISDGTLNLFNGSGNDLGISGGTLTLNNALATINAPSGSNVISATSGTVNLSNGSLATGVYLYVYNSTALNINQGAATTFTLNGTIYNFSPNAIWNPTATTLAIGSNGYFENESTGVLTITGSGAINLGSASSASRLGSFANYGIVTKTTAATLNINTTNFYNFGTFQLTTLASTVNINAAGNSSGAYSATIAGSIFNYELATKTFYAGTILAGSGTHNINAAISYLVNGTSQFGFSSTINFNSPAGIPADINISNATLNCNKGVSFDGPGYCFFTNTSSINVAATGSFSTAKEDTVNVTSSFSFTTLNLNNTVTIGGPMVVASATINGAGTAYFSGATLTNTGTIQNSNFKFNGLTLQTVTGSTGKIAVVEIVNPNNVRFSTNHHITSSLSFTTGKVDINSKLFIPGTAAINGYGTNKYFFGNGYLKRTLAASTAYTYPVGTAEDYLPATITTAATFTPDTIWTRVENYDLISLYDSQLYPIGSYVTTHAVYPVWRINESTASGSVFTSLKLQWNKSNESYLFNRASCGIVRNSVGSWNTPVAGAAAGTDPYTRTLNTVTLAASKAELFAVVDNSINFATTNLYSNSQTRSNCAGSSFTFGFNVGDSLKIIAGNIFTAQLSNAYGSFASPVSIGSVTARGGRNLTVTIPPGTPVGNYYIRMVASNPSIVEQENYLGAYYQRLSVQANCYCGPNTGLPNISLSSCASNYISVVKFGTLNHFTTCDELTGLSYSSYGIEEYDSDGPYIPNTTSIIRGLTTNLSVTTNTSSIISVWIDYNKNGIYEASEWTQVTSSSVANTAAVIGIAVPASASLGLTGMRIRSRLVGNSNGSADACTTFGSGETEEYYIYIADNLAFQSNSPSSNSRCVATNTSPSITFNSPIKSASVIDDNFLVQGSISGIKPAVLSGAGTNTITINPTQNFEAGELITVATSGSNIKDTSDQTATEYCYQFTALAAVAPKTFKKHTLTGSGVSVSNSYSADFNNDGFSDILDVNSSAATGYLSIYKGNGNGTFLAPTFIYTGGIPYSAAIADYDLDGDMDVAVAYGSKYKIDIYYNTGTGTFTGPSSISASHRPRTIIPFYAIDNVAPSIVSANYSDSTISVFENTGNGILTEISRRSVFAPVQSVVAGDFNLNGLLDVAATTNANKIVILEFASRKSLTIRSIFSCGGTFPIDIKTADFNGDGDLDLVWTNFTSSNVGYVKGSTAIGFDTLNLATISTSTFPFRLAVADFDGDCDIDVACATATSLDFNLLANTSGSFASYNGPKGNSPAGYVSALAAADYDEDGDIDLIGSSVTYNAKSFLENATYTIQTGSVTGPICNNATTLVTWTVSDSLPAANIFYVQLSDASGSFATPTYLDTVVGTFSGSTSFSMPTVTSATAYRIRVISSTVGVVYFDNGVNISIGTSPVNPNINFACSGTSTILSATGGTTYTWSPATYLSAATGSPVTATPLVTQIITMIAKDIAGCSSAARTASVGPTCYCYPNYTNNTCTNDYISSVVLNTLNYSNTTCGGNDNNTTINYYTTVTPNVATDLNRLSSYTLALTAGAANPEGFGVWIDYNKDGDYDDSGEFIYASPTTANQTFTTTITIPGTATVGVTRMRVMITRGAVVPSTQNCVTTLPRGETQDFYIRINGCAAPTVYNVSGGGSICTAQTTSVNLSNSTAGVTYALFRNAVSTGTSLTGTGASLVFGSVSTAGTYSVYATTPLGCTLKMQDSVNVVVVSNPTSAAAGLDQTKCGQTTATLTANAPTSGTGSWTIVSGSGGSFSSTTNPAAIFTAALGSSNILRWTISNSPCTSSTDDVSISFPFNPTTAAAGADQLNLCGLTSTTLAANAPTVGTGAWTIIAGTGGSLSNAASPTSTFIGTAGTTYTLRWTITNSTCTASTDDVVVAFPKNPTVANAGTSQTLCGATSTTLAGNAPTVGTGIWTIFSGTGGSLGSATSATSTFNGVAGNTYVLFWTISNSPCTASADSMVVFFPRNPSTSVAGSDQTKCGLTSATLAGNTPTVGSGLWTKITGSGGSFGNATSPASSFTGTAGISYTLRWTISNSPCASSTDDVSVSFPFNPTVAAAGNDTNICNGSTINLKGNSATVGTGTWTIASGSCSINNTALASSTANNFTNNTITSLVWSISNGVCPTSRDTVKINSNSTFCAATLADFNANSTTTCTGTSITFTDLSSNATSWSWNFGTNATPPTANTQGPHTVSYSTTGSKTVALTATGPGGSNTSTKTNYISVITSPGTPTGIAGISSVCAGTNSVTYSISSVLYASSYVWTVPLNATIASGSGTTSITVNYSATATSGNVSVYGTNACGNGSPAILAVTVSQTPTPANAGGDQLNLCGSTSTTLAGNTPTSGTGLWTIISGTGGSFTNASLATTVFSGTLGNTYTLRWSISNAPCTTSSDDVVITFNQNPTTAAAGNDQLNLCGLTSATLAANTPLSGTGSWSIVSGSGGSFSNANLANSVFVGTAGNSYTLRWTISKSPCTASTDDVVITFPLNPSTSFAGLDQTVCGVTSVVLAANVPTVGAGAWTVVSGTGGSFVNAALASSTFNGTAGNSYTLRWTVSNSPCTASSDDVVISLPRNPSTANAGLDQLSLCGVTVATLTATTPAVGTGLWTVVSGGSGSFGNASSAGSTFTGTIGNTYTLRWTVSNSPCTSSADEVIIALNQNPTSANAGADQTLCGASSATLAANTPLFGLAAWTVVSGTGGSFSATNNAAATFFGTAGVSYVLRWSITNSPCGNSSDDVAISFPQNASIAAAGSDQTLCGLTTATLNGNVPLIGTGIWTKVSGTGGSFANASSASSTFTGTAGVTYTLRWTINNAPCLNSSDDVVIYFPANPTTSNAGFDQTLCGQTAAILAANAPTAGTGMWTVVSGSGGSFVNSALSTSTFNGTAGSSYTLRWTISNSTCTPSADDVLVSLPQNPTIANAGPDQSLCGSTALSLNANAAVVGIGSWSIVSGNGGSFSSASNPFATFTGASGVSYTLRWTITNAPCTASSDDVNIALLQLPTTAFAGNDTTICNGSSISLSANTALIGTGQWSVVSGAATIASASLPNSNATAFSVDSVIVLVWTISTANSCADSRDTVVVSSNTSVCIVTLADFVANTTSACENDTVIFTDASNQATAWNWNFGAGANPPSANGVGPYSVTYSTPGFKTVSLSVTGPGGSDTKTKTNYIEVIQTPSAAASISGLTAVCQGQTNVNYSVPLIANAASYNWILPNGATLNTFNQNSITIDFGSNAISGNISVEGENSCGLGASSQVAITVNNLPAAATAISGSDTICDAASNVIFSTPSIVNASAYVWILSPGLTSNSGSDTTASPQISVNLSAGISSGTIQVYGLNACGQGDTSATFNFYVAPYPAAAGTITGANVVSACLNQTGITYSIPVVANATGYNWTLPPSATLVSGANTNSIVVDYAATSLSGDVAVSGVNSCGVGATAVLNVNFNSVPKTEICYATVDSATVQCLLFWQRPAETYVDSFIIYSDPTGGSNLSRLTGIKNSTTIQTNYLDPFSSPIINSVSYQIATKDSCNNQLSLSGTIVHKTINLNGTLGWGGVAKLYWNEYLGINDPGRFYSVLRDTIGTGPFNDTLATNILPGSGLNYTDTSSYKHLNCRYVIVMDFSTNCDPSLKMMATKSTSRSNIKDRNALVPDAVSEIHQNDFSAWLFPNPAKGSVNIVLNGMERNFRISLCDITGREIISEKLLNTKTNTTKTQFNLSAIAPGIYFVKVESENGMRKIMKLKVE